MDSIDFPFASNVCVQNVIDLLVRENSRDRYRLTEGGSGCMYWCLTVLGDIERKAWIAMGSGSVAYNWLNTLRPRFGSLMPWPARQGVFY